MGFNGVTGTVLVNNTTLAQIEDGAAITIASSDSNTGDLTVAAHDFTEVIK